MTRPNENLFGSVLIAGFVLAAIGLAYQPQTGQTVPQRMPSLAYGTADSNGRIVAVTGVDLTGSSILYVIDTETLQLAVYQANGGSASTQNVKLVGARRIALDLQLYGFKDESEHSYEQLEKKFIESGILESSGK